MFSNTKPLRRRRPDMRARTAAEDTRATSAHRPRLTRHAPTMFCEGRAATSVHQCVIAQRVATELMKSRARHLSRALEPLSVHCRAARRAGQRSRRQRTCVFISKRGFFIVHGAIKPDFG